LERGTEPPSEAPGSKGHLDLSAPLPKEPGGFPDSPLRGETHNGRLYAIASNGFPSQSRATGKRLAEEDVDCPYRRDATARRLFGVTGASE